MEIRRTGWKEDVQICYVSADSIVFKQKNYCSFCGWGCGGRATEWGVIFLNPEAPKWNFTKGHHKLFFFIDYETRKKEHVIKSWKVYFGRFMRFQNPFQTLCIMNQKLCCFVFHSDRIISSNNRTWLLAFFDVKGTLSQLQAILTYWCLEECISLSNPLGKVKKTITDDSNHHQQLSKTFANFVVTRGEIKEEIFLFIE